MKVTLGFFSDSLRLIGSIVIVCADGQIIVDDVRVQVLYWLRSDFHKLLHDVLVKPLPENCRLTAVFDCCASGEFVDTYKVHLIHVPIETGTALGTPRPRWGCPQGPDDSHARLVREISRCSIASTAST